MKCDDCNYEQTLITQMPEGHIHYAKQICPACNSFKWLKRPKNNFNTEKDFVDRVEKVLKEKNIETWREVNPDDSRFRIDLIFKHNDLLFALEAKNLKSIRQGAVIAKTIEQIKRYKQFTFFNGKKIDKWCLSFPSDKTSYWGTDEVKRHVEEFLLYFLKYHDIETLYLRQYPNSDYDFISISPLTPDSISIKKEGEDGSDK